MTDLFIFLSSLIKVVRALAIAAQAEFVTLYGLASQHRIPAAVSKSAYLGFLSERVENSQLKLLEFVEDTQRST